MFAEPSMPERQQSPNLAANFSSNNPFRNRATSPVLASPTSASADRSSSGSRPMSRNPFLTTFEAEFNKEASRDLIDMSAKNNLTIEDDARRRGPQRPGNFRSGTDPRAGHRPSPSDEEKEKMRGAPRGPPRPRGPPGPRPPTSRSPERREHRRPRRNSESSIADKGSLDPNEERRRRERRREREARTRDGKDSKDGKDGRSTQKRVRKPQGLDLIDKLDVTGIYGPSMIHHDGPYDAVQPHRNRKKDQRAPMHAFPVGSANNSLGGSGPVNTKIDLDRIHGRGAEGFTDFGGREHMWSKPRQETEFSAKGREDIVHGDQSHGLGTSTFLEGAPASRKAIEEDSEKQRAGVDSGLGRKKSIAQRFRGISQPRRNYDGPRITSPDSRYGPASPPGPTGSYSAGPLAQTKATEQNPFFADDYDKAYEAKGAVIQSSETDTKELPASPPRNTLTRAVTSDSLGSPTNETNKPSVGFLNRVKSLKGGRGGRRRPA